MRLILTFLLLLFLVSCDKDVFETEDFNGSWEVEWIRCDNFHNKVFGKISFTMTDSTVNRGVIKETVTDSVTSIDEFNFHFDFISNDELLIDTLFYSKPDWTIDTLLIGDTIIHWLGTHSISELEEKSFLLERQTKACERELFKFVK